MKQSKTENNKQLNIKTHNSILKYILVTFVFTGLGIGFMLTNSKISYACCIGDTMQAPCGSGYDGCGGTLCCCGTSCNPPTCTAITATPSSASTGGIVALAPTTTLGSSYLWTGSGVFTPNNTKNTNWTAPGTPKTYTVSLKVTNAYGNKTCTKAIGVSTPTAPTCSGVTANPSTVLTGGVAALTGNTSGTVTSYSWTAPGGGTFSSTTTNPTNWTAPPNPGTYTATLTVTNVAGSNTCSTNITVNPPAPTCVSITANPSTVVVGGNVTLTGNTSGTVTSYSWTASNGAFTFPTNNSTNWTAPGTPNTYTVTLTVSNVTGSSTCNKTIDVILPTPTCTAGILYITPDPANPSTGIKFKNKFTTFGNPLLIITDLPVLVSSGVGTPPVSGSYNFPINASPDIQAAIITSKDITVEHSTGVENVVMLKGPLVAKGSINFNRDVGTQNSKTPAQAVKYDPTFLCEAAKLERAYPGFLGLGLVNIQWVYSE
jgi:PKD repeat protein